MTYMETLILAVVPALVVGLCLWTLHRVDTLPERLLNSERDSTKRLLWTHSLRVQGLLAANNREVERRREAERRLDWLQRCAARVIEQVERQGNTTAETYALKLCLPDKTQTHPEK